jgi:hypothetical protein
MVLKDLKMEIKPIIFEMAISKMPKTMKELVFVLNNSSIDEIKELFAGKEIGAGSFKVVYELNDDYVLKVSEDETHEIKKEVEIKTCGGDKFLTKIYAYDTVGYTWVISEKVRGLNPARDTLSFVEYLKGELEGSDFLNTETWIETYGGEEEKIINYELEGEMFIRAFLGFLTVQKRASSGKKSPWLKQLLSVIRRCDINPGDLFLRNWGRRRNGDFVILDYGFTKKF